jgi:hypothetical protein
VPDVREKEIQTGKMMRRKEREERIREVTSMNSVCYKKIGERSMAMPPRGFAPEKSCSAPPTNKL